MPRKFSSNTGINGLLIVNKPEGPSSMDVVRRVRRAAKNTKTGHAGTLDPLAQGVVICCLGKATKRVEALMELAKVYQTTIDLSALTTTDDREGEKTEIQVTAPPDQDAVKTALQHFIGEIKQVPPSFSAVHVNGQRAYKLARQGKEITMPPRCVRIDHIEMLSYNWPFLELRITCGRGTYIRSLARELGQKLGTGGYLTFLQRTSVGAFHIDNAWKLDDLDKMDITGQMLID